MERKLVKQGRNALTMTLPSDWLKAKGLTAGDTVQVEIGNDELIIRTKTQAAVKEITLDVHREEKSIAHHLLNTSYIEGYDRITILHDAAMDITTISRKLIGMIIESHTPTKTVISSIINVPETSIEIILRRILHMISEHSNQLTAIAEKNLRYGQFKEEERLIDDHIFYCLRHLNKYEQHVAAYRYFLLFTSLEGAMDQLSEIAKHLKTKKLAELLVEHTKAYCKLLGAEDFKGLYTSLRNFRNSVPKTGFAEGLVHAYAETLYNNIGYLTKANK